MSDYDYNLDDEDVFYDVMYDHPFDHYEPSDLGIDINETY